MHFERKSSESWKVLKASCAQQLHGQGIGNVPAAHAMAVGVGSAFGTARYGCSLSNLCLGQAVAAEVSATRLMLGMFGSQRCSGDSGGY